MKHLRMFVVSLLLMITAMTACTPNQEKKETATVAGNAGNFLIIRGHGFSQDKASNKVIFGEVSAQVLHADADYLLVQVPEQKADTVQVVVAVGDNISNAMLFEYHPTRKLVAAVQGPGNDAY
ncbi:IPT/TIG domain-containing protein [Chitinophaga sp. HK235]|uniref:IPT/TIG domain-containing protein n=1 Tax=Chitinophaga sp. HK235 TaxID=2952571 RepID=UPI001BAE4BF5|nr:IPT/TIG domain-containing protein [Chitinophaga sp. HK235]